MAFSKIQIISNALILLGDEPISSLTESSAGAKVGSNLYDSAYYSILSSHRWSFATAKVQLSRLSAAPQNEFQYQYQLPTDIIMLISTYPTTRYKILGDKLYANESTAEIDYIKKVTEDQLPNYFIKAFEYYLAQQFCIAITEDLNKMEAMRRQYDVEVRRARYVDSQSAPVTPIVDAPYIFARNF